MKFKKYLSLALAAVLSVSLIGCTPKEEESSKGGELEESLVIYSTHPEDLLESVAAGFEEETGVKVDFINLKGELAEKVEAEKEDPQADIMYGGSSATYLELSAKDLFEKSEPTWAKDLDPMFKDENGLWYGTIQTPVMMFYNTEVVSKEEAPKDWKDLTDERFADKLVFRNAESSSAKATYSSLLYQYDKEGKIEEGWDYLKALDKNTKKYFGNESLLFQAIGRKEAGVSYSVLSSIVENKNNGLPLEIVDAESGSVVITDGVAQIKNCKHPNAAKAFMEYVGSAETQAKIANEFNRVPTLKAALENSPEWMSQTTYKAMDIDWSVLAKNQSDWMQKWDSEIKNTAKDVKEEK